jgi:hypothetical protein
MVANSASAQLACNTGAGLLYPNAARFLRAFPNDIFHFNRTELVGNSALFQSSAAMAISAIS